MIRTFKEEPYTWLSNFAPCKIVLDDIEYPSVEHAYQSKKSDNLEWKKTCADTQFSAGKIKALTRDMKVRDDWNKKKFAVMYKCLKQKFSQEPYKSKLLETKYEYVMEGNLWGDKEWGVCLKTEEGQNYLGRLIMKVRSELSGINYKKVGIVGSRSLSVSPHMVYDFLPETTEKIISGGCPTGVDSVAEYIADTFETKITDKRFEKIIHYADWDVHGKGAGFIRNQYIADDSDYLLAFWDKKSKGTMDTVNKMRKLGKPVKLITIQLPVEA